MSSDKIKVRVAPAPGHPFQPVARYAAIHPSLLTHAICDTIIDTKTHFQFKSMYNPEIHLVYSKFLNHVKIIQKS